MICALIVGMSGHENSQGLTPELRRLADQAADATTAALHAALAHRIDAAHGLHTPVETRLSQQIGALPEAQRQRLLARAKALGVHPGAAVATRARARFTWRGLVSEAPSFRPRNGTPWQGLDLQLKSLRCDDDTSEAGADEMSIGLVRIVLNHNTDPVESSTAVAGPFALGKYRRGDSRNFSPPLDLASVGVGEGRTLTSVLLLAEVDFGGLHDLLRTLAGEVSETLLTLVATLAESAAVGFGAAAGGAFLGTLGSIFGPVGTVAGTALGIALGAALGYAVCRVFAGLVQMFRDDPLAPQSVVVAIPGAVHTPEQSALVQQKQVTFVGRGGKYTAVFDWRLR